MRARNESCVTLGEFHLRLAITEVSNNNGKPFSVSYRCPQSCSFVVATTGKIIASIGKSHLPHREHMAFIGYKAAPSLQAPKANGAIFGTTEELRAVRTKRDTVHLKQISIMNCFFIVK